MTQDIQVKTIVARIIIKDTVSSTTRQLPLKWLLKRSDYESLVVKIRFGLEDLIESVDQLDGSTRTGDG